MFIDNIAERYRGQTPPWGEVGYIVYKRTYARPVEGGGKEEWVDTVARVLKGLDAIGCPMSKAEYEALFDHMFNLRATVSGRALWQLGTPVIDRLGGDSLNNCWHVVCDKLDAFCFTFNELMLGGGVGFNIEPQHVYALPVVKYAPDVARVDNPDCDFIVPDNREGWVELLWRVLKAHFQTGKPLRYYTSCIRSRGKPIRTFGGIASGSEGLVRGIHNICTVLKNRQHQKLRPVDCLDIMNIIGTIVVSGNVRRSAQIAIGSVSDFGYLKAKRWDLGSLPNWRSMSNNSVTAGSMSEVPDMFWEGYKGNGEPYGLLNVPLARRIGRIGEEMPDFSIKGCNPCSEIFLGDKEACNLSEIYLPNIRNMTEFHEVAQLLYKVCKSISGVPYIYPESQEIIRQNSRIGIGVTGYLSSKWVGKGKAFDEVYVQLRELDSIWSKKLGLNESVRLTTVKPSGTLSLLPKNCSPGMHPPFANYMIRRIRFASDDPLVDVCRQHGYWVEPAIQNDGSHDQNTMVVEFPMKLKGPTNLKAVESLENQRFLQRHWSDNSVSATHYYKSEELPEVQAWLDEHYDDEVKAASFLLHSGHGFAQAPLEPINKESYDSMVAASEPITSIDFDGDFEIDSQECSGGHCPVR